MPGQAAGARPPQRHDRPKTSLGARLKQERTARGVTLQQIAEATKIGARYLEAIENDQFDRLPGGVFDRGFVRAYAGAVGLDPEATVEAYLAQRRAGAAAEPDTTLDALRAALEAHPDRARSPRGAARRIALATLALGVLVAAAALWIVTRREGADDARAETVPAHGAVVSALETNPAGEASDPGRTGSTPPGEQAPTPPPGPQTLQYGVRPGDGLALLPDGSAPIEARVVIDRAVSGTLNCDNRRVEVLDGVPGGTTLELACHRYLVVNADDGGALRIGIGGADPAPLGGDGEPVLGHRVSP